MNERRSSARGLMWLALSLCALSLVWFTRATPAEATNLDPTPPRPTSGQFLLMGSSSVNGSFGRLIEFELQKKGVDVLRHGRSATGLARPDFFDWHKHIKSAGSLAGTRGAILLLGGNDTQSLYVNKEDRGKHGGEEWVQWRDEASWRAEYRARTRDLVNALCAAGVPKVLVVAPNDGSREGWSRKIARVQEEQLAGANESRCGRGLDTRNPSRSRPDDTSDGVHLSRVGAQAVWKRVGEDVFRYFGLPVPQSQSTP